MKYFFLDSDNLQHVLSLINKFKISSDHDKSVNFGKSTIPNFACNVKILYKFPVTFTAVFKLMA